MKFSEMSAEKGTKHQPEQETAEVSEFPVDRRRPENNLPRYYPPQPAYADDEIDLVDLWRALAKNWVWIVLMTVLGTALASAKAFRATPIYRGEVLTVPISPSQETGRLSKIANRLGDFAGIASITGIDVMGKDIDVAAALATLTSREFTLAFISDNELMPILFESRWDPTNKTWAVEDPKEIPTEWDAYRLFDEKIRNVSRDKKSGLVTLSIEWRDRRVVADWANELVKRINRQQQQRTIEDAEKNIAFLTAQLDKTTVYEIQQSIYRLIEAQAKLIMMANVRDEFAFEVIDKAIPPDEGDFVKPKRILIIALGFAGGLLLGVTLAFFKSYVEKQNARAREAGGEE